MAQVDLVVGDIEGNTAKILDYSQRARKDLRADLVIFPELSVCGYPPEDLLFHAGLQRRVADAMERIRSSVRDIAVLVGYPEYENDQIYNAAVVFCDGEPLAQYRKQLLPNYRVFDEERYFDAGREPAVFSIHGIRLGMTICEDIWRPSPVAASRAAGAEDAHHLRPRSAVHAEIRLAVRRRHLHQHDLRALLHRLAASEEARHAALAAAVLRVIEALKRHGLKSKLKGTLPDLDCPGLCTPPALILLLTRRAGRLVPGLQDAAAGGRCPDEDDDQAAHQPPEHRPIQLRQRVLSQ